MLKTAIGSAAATRRSGSRGGEVTIGGLARAAEVGVETVRYYQRRRLLAVPPSSGGVRRYPATVVDRIRFIKRSQNLGFSLDEIRDLMKLESGGSRGAIRKIAGARLTTIRDKISALEQMEKVLAALLRECDHTNAAAPCPIIAALNTSHTADVNG